MLSFRQAPEPDLPNLARERWEEKEAADTRRIARLMQDGRREAVALQQKGERIGLVVPSVFDDPAFRPLAERHHEIATRLSDLGREHLETKAAIDRGFLANRDAKVAQQARAILDGKGEKAFAGYEPLKAKLERIDDEMAAYGRALVTVREQIAAFVSERSIDMEEVAAPYHQRSIVAVAEACTALLQALADEADIRRLVTAGGYDDRLPRFLRQAGNQPLPAYLEQLEQSVRGCLA